METSGKILMISGGALAVLVAGLVSLLLARQPVTTTLLPNATVGAASLQPAMAPVLIATRRIPRGAVVHASDVGRLFKQVYEPAGVVSGQTTFSDAAQLSALLAVIPRRTIETIAAPLFSGMAVPGQSDNSLAVRLARGFDGETLTIPIAGDAVDGAIKVNDRVDVLYSMPLSSSCRVLGYESAAGSNRPWCAG